jgi:Mn-dependent DtxR family transcriptional regulator
MANSVLRGSIAKCPMAAMPNLATLSENWEDYLERIHELIERKGYARVADIAEQLDIAPASVSTMVQRLAKAGLLNYEKYRGLTLTSTGQAAALGIRHRHRVLTEFLSTLGVPPDQLERDVEGMEHHMSSITVEKIEALLPKLPKLLGSQRPRTSPR